jgi:hypothetical protein
VEVATFVVIGQGPQRASAVTRERRAVHVPECGGRQLGQPADGRSCVRRQAGAGNMSSAAMGGPSTSFSVNRRASARVGEEVAAQQRAGGLLPSPWFGVGLEPVGPHGF